MVSKTNVFLLKMIKRILEDGIYLGEIESSEKYLLDVCAFFNLRNDLFAHFDHKALLIDDAAGGRVMTLSVRNNTLYITPAMEDTFFFCFKNLLEFACAKANPKKKKEVKKTIDDSEFEWI